MAEPSAALFVENYNVNPFVPNAPFLYPLKTPENRKVFWCFKFSGGRDRVQWEQIG